MEKLNGILPNQTFPLQNMKCLCITENCENIYSSYNNKIISIPSANPSRYSEIIQHDDMVKYISFVDNKILSCSFDKTTRV